MSQINQIFQQFFTAYNLATINANTQSIYSIYNTRNSRSFIAYTNNLIEGILANLTKLEKGTHPCKSLQSDYKIFKGDFRIILLSPYSNEYEKRYILGRTRGYIANDLIYNLRNLHPFTVGMDFLDRNTPTPYKLLVFLQSHNNCRHDRRIPVGVFNSIREAQAFTKKHYPDGVIRNKIVCNNTLTSTYLDWWNNNSNHVYRTKKQNTYKNRFNIKKAKDVNSKSST